MTVQAIEATKPLSGAAPAAGQSPGLIRVAAYCRVSTDSEEQETSFEGR